MDQLTIYNSEIQISVVAAGPRDGTPVILLHGFPEFWYAWHKQIPSLADAGFRVIVPDQRGYNRSSKPSEVRAYSLRELISDVIAIGDQLHYDRFCLAGHDWGAAVAWGVAMQHPERVHRLAILNVPHPAVMLRYLAVKPRQTLRSWYMFFFQLPRLPEALFAAGNFKVGTSSLVRTSRAGTFSPNDLQLYREAWSQPGAVTGMINWYRALFRSPLTRALTHVHVRVPTRIIWGDQDRFLVPEMAQDSLSYCTKGELIPLPEATHWLQHEEPEQVSNLLIEFFSDRP